MARLKLASAMAQSSRSMAARPCCENSRLLAMESFLFFQALAHLQPLAGNSARQTNTIPWDVRNRLSIQRTQPMAARREKRNPERENRRDLGGRMIASCRKR